jgi:hypothetical protein
MANQTAPLVEQKRQQIVACRKADLQSRFCQNLLPRVRAYLLKPGFYELKLVN